MNANIQNIQKQFTQPGTNDALKIISLGSFGEVTQNMFVYEFAPQGNFSKSQIIIVDCGVGFPEEDEFGVDLQIPDTTYLEDKKDRIQAIIITHGHEDHIGAIRFVLPILGQNIPIYAPKLATAFIQERLLEAGQKARINTYDRSSIIKLDNFYIKPVAVNHSIPDTFHLSIKTSLGVFYHGSDFKFDFFPIDGKHADYEAISRIGNDENVVCLLSDCLGSDHEGFSPSEASIAEKFEYEIKTGKGRVFVTSISSNILRWKQAIEYGKRNGRKVVVVGFSVDKAIKIAQELGYIKLNKEDIVPVERIKNFRDNQLIFLVAGFAGQPTSALSKIVMGKHRIKISKGDKVIFSSPDYIPGTTSGIYKMIDNLAKMGAEVTYGKDEAIHVSGHGYQKDHALLISLLRPKYILPIGGNYRHIKAYQLMCQQLGRSDDQFILPEPDEVVTFRHNRFDTNSKISLRKVLIDGFGIGDVGATVLRDRRTLAEDGMFSVVLLVDTAQGKLIKEPVLLSRGFVFAKENQELLNLLKSEIMEKFREYVGKPMNVEFVRQKIQGHLEESIFKHTGRQPMILPLLIEV